ncbi:MAG: hypothetical protein RLZZ206_3471 [Cyanobacteriota bacterium]|jgi:hypothetical protein
MSGGRFATPFRIERGEAFRLKDIDPGDTGQVLLGQGTSGRSWGCRTHGPDEPQPALNNSLQ